VVVNYTILPVSDLILKPRACIKSKRKNLQPKNRVALLNKQVLSGLEIISRLPPVKLSGQTYFCSDTTHFWPDKYPLRRVSINFFPPPPPARCLYIKQVHLLRLYCTSSLELNARKSGTHSTAAMFGKINITFVHTTIASVPCLQYG